MSGVTLKYAKYIQSHAWRRRRLRYLRTLKRRKCEACDTPAPLQVHHRTYERMGRELDADLNALCERCHELVHLIHRTSPSRPTLPEATDLILVTPAGPPRNWPEVEVGHQHSSLELATDVTRKRQRARAANTSRPHEGFGSRKGRAVTAERQRAEAKRLIMAMHTKSNGRASLLSRSDQRRLRRAMEILHK